MQTSLHKHKRPNSEVWESLTQGRRKMKRPQRGINKNVLRGIRHLNSWSLLGAAAVWEGLGGMARWKKDLTGAHSPVTMPATSCHILSSGIISSNKLFLLYVAVLVVFSHNNGKITNTTSQQRKGYRSEDIQAMGERPFTGKTRWSFQHRWEQSTRKTQHLKQHYKTKQTYHLQVQTTGHNNVHKFKKYFFKGRYRAGPSNSSPQGQAQQTLSTHQSQT